MEEIRLAVVDITHHFADCTVVLVQLPYGRRQMVALAEVEMDAVVVPPIVMFLIEHW